MSYYMFLLIASATIASPGPGVLLTISNTLNKGRLQAFWGYLGLSLGAMIIAAISSAGVGFLILTSDLLFTGLKLFGAGYLIYMGIKLFFKRNIGLGEITAQNDDRKIKYFGKGVLIQFSNPKLIIFFVVIFPQFIDENMSFPIQFLYLVTTYSLTLLIIHFFYTCIIKYIKNLLLSERGTRLINNVTGCLFVIFAFILLLEQQNPIS